MLQFTSTLSQWLGLLGRDKRVAIHKHRSSYYQAYAIPPLHEGHLCALRFLRLQTVGAVLNLSLPAVHRGSFGFTPFHDSHYATA